MELAGHALRKILGNEGLCECGVEFAVAVPRDKRVRPIDLADAVMDAHRWHLEKVIKKGGKKK